MKIFGLLFTFLFLTSFSAQADLRQCNLLFSNQVETLKAASPRLWDSYYSFNFQNFEKILFLSNGDKGAYMEKNDPSQLIVSSDFEINFGINTLVDNNKLPFKDNTFDLIFMNRGLCLCRGAAKACGGIDTHHESMKKFLTGAIRVLDKKHENSVAILTGYYFPGTTRSEIAKMWNSVLMELKTEFPALQFALLKAENLNGKVEFMGLAVSTGAQPISKSINLLHPYLVDDRKSVLAPVSQ